MVNNKKKYKTLLYHYDIIRINDRLDIEKLQEDLESCRKYNK